MTVKKATGDSQPSSTSLVPAKEPGITFIQQVIKGDTYLVLSTTAREPEDEFTGLYFTAADSSKVVLKPPFDPKSLIQLTETNNILYQCIEAMEVNIDGTGHEFEALNEGTEADKNEVSMAEEFFSEPYPGQSFVSQRRSVRRDLEGVGYGFLEVLRTVSGELIAVRHLAAHSLRMVKLDQPVPVKKKIQRGGKEIEITINERERRFAMNITQGAGAGQYQYYREYGSTRQLHRETGEWETPQKPVPMDKRASEVLLFGMNPDSGSPYFLPRWINQLPSVIGSRKAEETNLEYFDAGGMPPAIIFIQGGTLGKGVADQLRMYLSGQNKSRNRAAVVEALSSSGSLESAGGVQVKVERFGAEKASDSMYSKYDQAAEEHVRIAFRLPPIFLGKTVDYNYATAKTAYMVAEAQVFAPERTEFDELINRTIMKELGFKTIKFRSLPITLKDAELAMEALTLVKDSVDGKGLINEVNQIADLSLEYKEPADPLVQQAKEKDLAHQYAPKDLALQDQTNALDAKHYERLAQIDAKYKKNDPKRVAAKKLADEYIIAEGLDARQIQVTPESRETICKAVDDLQGDDRDLFLQAVSENLLDGEAILVCEH